MLLTLRISLFTTAFGLALGLWTQIGTAATFSIDFSTATLNGTPAGFGFYSPTGTPTSSLVFDAEKVTSGTSQTLIRFTHTPLSSIDITGASIAFNNSNLAPDLSDDTFGIEFQERFGTSPFDPTFYLRFEFAADTVDSFMNAMDGDVFTVDVFAEELQRSFVGPTFLFGSANTSLEITTLDAFVPLPGTAAAMLGGLGLLGAIAARRQRVT